MASSSHLKQGEGGVISARVATLNKSGAFTDTIEVKSNDPKRPKVILTLLGAVIEKSPPADQGNSCK
jgi:hypothetical protein